MLSFCMCFESVYIYSHIHTFHFHNLHKPLPLTSLQLLFKLHLLQQTTWILNNNKCLNTHKKWILLSNKLKPHNKLQPKLLRLQQPPIKTNFEIRGERHKLIRIHLNVSSTLKQFWNQSYQISNLQTIWVVFDNLRFKLQSLNMWSI